MNGLRGVAATAGALGMCCAFAVAEPVAVQLDDPQDATLRLTDPGALGAIPNLTLPDIRSITLSGWTSPTAASNPFLGWPIEGEKAHLFRLVIVLRGLINPPGTLGHGGSPYLPDQFGPSPIYGSVEIDVDEDLDTGGDLGGVAANRRLANMGRFGIVPRGSLGARMARAGSDVDLSFFSTPQYERSGADFALTMCGCFGVQIAQRIAGDTDSLFEADEAWVVRGRFFQRTGGYQGASFAFGGSGPGLYDPPVDLLFAHDADADQTTITLVYALDQRGASLLTGQVEQAIDFNVGNQTSVEEALEDVITAVGSRPLSGPTATLSSRWQGRTASAYLLPTEWRVGALVGAAYTTPLSTLYAWTDTLGDERLGDLNADGDVDQTDREAFRTALDILDGSPADCDAAANGEVVICTPGQDWSLLDFTGDARVDSADFDMLREPCRGDITGDHHVDFADLAALLATYGGPATLAAHDLNDDGAVDFLDLNILLSVFGQPCP